VIGFFNAYRGGERVTRHRLRDIAEHFHNWVKNRAQKWGASILDAPAGRRDDFVAPYFKQAKTDQVLVILKAREPARIMTAIGQAARWHLQLPGAGSCSTAFTCAIGTGAAWCLLICRSMESSQSAPLAGHKMRAQGIDFEQRSNACAAVGLKLQELADFDCPRLAPCGKMAGVDSVF
jgi:hypothetical protein